MKHIVITGASSGIGRALALRYAAPDTRLSLLGRDAARLEAVAETVRGSGAAVETAIASVTDAAAIAAIIAHLDAGAPIDLLIANAGILDGRRQDQQIEDLATATRVFETNLIGALNTIHAALPAMQSRGRGQIAIVASLAAFSPLPDAPAYAASKAALLSYGLALRDALGPSGIAVNVVTPGYVETNMTVGHIGAQPFKISAEAAADRIARGLARNGAIIGFPAPLYLMSRFSALLPDRWRAKGSAGFRFHIGKASDEKG